MHVLISREMERRELGDEVEWESFEEAFFTVNPPTGITGIGGGRKEEVEAGVTGEARERRFGGRGRESRGGICLNMCIESKYRALFSSTISWV